MSKKTRVFRAVNEEDFLLLAEAPAFFSFNKDTNVRVSSFNYYGFPSYEKYKKIYKAGQVIASWFKYKEFAEKIKLGGKIDISIQSKGFFVAPDGDVCGFVDFLGVEVKNIELVLPI